MNYRLSPADITTQAQAGQTSWVRSQIPSRLGTGYADRLALEDGMALIYSHYQPSHDLQEESVLQRDLRSLTITIALQGRSSYRGHDGSRFDFLAGHTTMTVFGSMQGERRYLAHEPVQQLRLILDEPLLQRYALASLLDPVPVGKPAHQLYFGGDNLAIQRLAAELAHLHARQGHPLDIRIAALTLLAEQTRRLMPLPAAQPGPDKDEARMLQVRDIMQQQYDRPLTIAYLCTAVGTNEFKLKQGFHELFGTTPHRMLTDIRMRKAWSLLEAGEPASTVAYKVGFQHPSSFSTAFARHFGRLPKSVLPTTRPDTPPAQAEG